MSRSSSKGDLVPKDITEILALQNKISKSRKKRDSSLSQTFGWFKGSKPKRIISNGQSRSGRLGGWTGECTTISQDADNHDASKGKSHSRCFWCLNFIVGSFIHLSPVFTRPWYFMVFQPVVTQ